MTRTRIIYLIILLGFCYNTKAEGHEIDYKMTAIPQDNTEVIMGYSKVEPIKSGLERELNRKGNRSTMGSIFLWDSKMENSTNYNTSRRIKK